MIDAAWRVVKAGESGDVAELIRLVHQLAGSAGMYGQAELGDKAAALEEAPEDYARAPSADPAAIERLVGALATLALASRAAFSAVP